MIDVHFSYISVIIFILILCFRVVFHSRSKLGIRGELIWVDRGKETKPFFNSEYRVLGKPDLMYKIRSGILAVEYKGRHGNIYQSDIFQAKTAALAARGSGYNVTKLLIKTDKYQRYVKLPKANKDLFKNIERFVNIARSASIGNKMKALPKKIKCRYCAFNYKCNNSY
jgi:CRISPR/Cas system-associated exonuclease Cas4 (RecB family)